jgi:hypothetical protein
MAKILEAKAVLVGEEKISPLLDKLAKRFDQVAKTAKGTEGVDRMAAALQNVQKQMAAIDKYSSAGAGFAKARQNYRVAQQAVQEAARAMQKGEGDAKKLARAYEQAQRAASDASRAFEREKRSAIDAKRGLDELGISGGRIVEQQRQLANAVDRASSAMDRQEKKASRLREQIGHVASTLGMIAGPGILHGTKEAVKSGASVQSRVVQMRAAGIPETEIQTQLDTSADLAAKYTNVGRADILERYKELRSVLLHPEEAAHLIEPTIRANAALNAVDTSGHMAEGLPFAIKGAEVLGLAQHPDRYLAYLDAFVKAQQVMGKTITPEQIFEFAKYSKASGAGLSDRFKMTTALSLSQEMGGSTTGKSVDQFVKQIVGGFQGNLHSAAKEFVALGLANAADFERSKTGTIKGMKPGRHVRGYQLAQSDPDDYVYKYLLPALNAHGYTTQDQQIGEIRRLFPAGTAADLVSKIITQRASFENHAMLYAQAKGLGAISLNQSDPFVALNSLTTSLESFAGVVTSPVMKDAASTMSWLATMLGNAGAALEKVSKAHPIATELAGGAAIGVGAVGGSVMTWNLISGVLGGFGLKSSAAALDGSAAALTAAAEALGGAGVAGKVAKAAEGAAPAAAASVFTRGAMAIPYVGAAAGLGYGLYQLHEAAEENHGTTVHERRGSRTDIYRRAFNEERAALGLPPIADPNRPVQAELHGEAEVKGEAKVTIEIPGFGTRDVRVPLKGTVNANGPGSLGVSSPDAGAHPVGIGHN